METTSLNAVLTSSEKSDTKTILLKRKDDRVRFDHDDRYIGPSYNFFHITALQFTYRTLSAAASGNYKVVMKVTGMS